MVIDAKTGSTVTAASVRAGQARCAQKGAIALAIADPNTRTRTRGLAELPQRKSVSWSSAVVRLTGLREETRGR